MKICRLLQALAVMIVFVSFQSTGFASMTNDITSGFDYVDVVYSVKADNTANTIKLDAAFTFAGVRLEPERLESVKNSITGFGKTHNLVKIFTGHELRYKDRPAWQV